MLAPQSVCLYLDSNSEFRCRAEESAHIDAYIRAMRVVQERTGAAPRSALANCAPVHIESLAGPVTVVRVSGLPHLQNPAHAPVRLADTEQALFMQRGDHYVLKTQHDGIEHTAYVALDYNISPRLMICDQPIVLRNPIDGMVADMNATRLLEIIQNRELTGTEQFVASQTMPTIWKRYGGPLVAAITNPTTEDAAQCYEFAQHFSDPYGRIRTIVELSSAWAKAFLGSQGEPVEHILSSDASRTRPVPQAVEAPLAYPAPVEERPRLRM